MMAFDEYVQEMDSELTALGRHSKCSIQEAPIEQTDFEICADIIINRIKKKAINVKLNNYYPMNLHSLKLKKFIEDTFEKTHGYSHTVSHGAVILALMALDVQFKRYKKRNYVRTINPLADKEYIG